MKVIRVIAIMHPRLPYNMYLSFGNCVENLKRKKAMILLRNKPIHRP